MNKWLLRRLRQATKRVTPKLSTLLIRQIADRAKKAKNQHDFVKRVRLFANGMARSLQQRGRVAKTEIAYFIKAVKTLAKIWTSVVSEVIKASGQPRIRLLRWLKPSLGNTQVFKKIDLVVEEVKCRLVEEYWPPTRQRCDFIPAPLVN